MRPGLVEAIIQTGNARSIRQRRGLQQSRSWWQRHPACGSPAGRWRTVDPTLKRGQSDLPQKSGRRHLCRFRPAARPTSRAVTSSAAAVFILGAVPVCRWELGQRWGTVAAHTTEARQWLLSWLPWEAHTCRRRVPLPGTPWIAEREWQWRNEGPDKRSAGQSGAEQLHWAFLPPLCLQIHFAAWRRNARCLSPSEVRVWLPHQSAKARPAGSHTVGRAADWHWRRERKLAGGNGQTQRQREFDIICQENQAIVQASATHGSVGSLRSRLPAAGGRLAPASRATTQARLGTEHVFFCLCPQPIPQLKRPPGLRTSKMGENKPVAGPSLKFALAVAIVSKRRQNAALEEQEQRVAELQRELEAAKALGALAAPQCPVHLLAHTFEQQQAPPSQTQQPSQPCALESQLACLGMWAHAGATLGHQHFMAVLQRYLLSKDAAATASSGGGHAATAPAASLLDRTPIMAALELLADVLAATKTPAARASGRGGGDTWAAAVSQAVEQACGCLAVIAGQPGAACWPQDFEALQAFASNLLEVAVPPLAPQQPGGLLTASAANIQHSHVPAAGPAPAGAGAKWRQPSSTSQPPPPDPPAERPPEQHELAQRMLGLLSQWPSTGMVVLGCAAVAAQATMARLVQAVTGEPLALAPSLSPSQPPASQQSAGAAAAAAASAAEAGADDERCLVQAFGLVQAQLLQQGLKALPGWMAELGACDDDFMQARAGVV